jgi:predicted kinase
VLQAMRRLKPKNVTKNTKQAEKSAANNNSQSNAENEATFTALVEKADILLNNGFQSILFSLNLHTHTHTQMNKHFYLFKSLFSFP